VIRCACSPFLIVQLDRVLGRAEVPGGLTDRQTSPTTPRGSTLVSWNEFIFALILTSTQASKTIPVIIAGFLVQLRFYDYGPMFAASVMAVLPPVVITLAFQRYLVRGMLSGSLKG
jgi:hypothetical protein